MIFEKKDIIQKKISCLAFVFNENKVKLQDDGAFQKKPRMTTIKLSNTFC
jgi:hypothetical protein